MKKQGGSSLIEVLLVLVMLGFLVILMSVLPNAITLIQRSKNLDLGREIAAKQIEDKRQTNFADLANGSTAISDSRLILLPGGSGNLLIEDCGLGICTNSENIKQVTVTINWTERNNPQRISLKTFVGEGGLNQ